jgi:Protein of unknown function with HXXEE motif
VRESGFVSFRGLVPLLIIAIAAHNFEEWLTFPHFGELTGAVGQRLGIEIQPKPWPIVQGALVFVTVVPVIILILRQRTKNPWGVWAIGWITSVFLANVFIPHIPAMILFGGYAPGGITAVLVNLPLTILALKKALSESLLSIWQIGLLLAVGILTLPAAVQLAYAVARIVLS